MTTKVTVPKAVEKAPETTTPTSVQQTPPSATPASTTVPAAKAVKENNDDESSATDGKIKAYPIPAEAEKVEVDIKKKKKELAGVKTSSLEDLEAKEQMIASYEVRLPRYPAELIKEENEAVSAKRELLQSEI